MHLEEQKELEQQFSGNFDDPFHISHAESLNIIHLPEDNVRIHYSLVLTPADKDFLQAQREKGRRGCCSRHGAVSEKKSRIRKRRLKTDMRGKGS